nr:hypothetical protein [Tanacetum cinerariifolium]
MTRSSTKEIFSPLKNLEQKFRSQRRLFDTPNLMELNSPEFDQISDIKEQSEEEVKETMTEIMDQYMSKTRGDYGPRVTRPAINQDTQFELKRAAGPGFYQQNNGNSSYPDQRPNLEESLTTFVAKSAKRHEENSNIIKEI